MVGPLLVDAPETSSASWVVDGQQRLTALAASLARQAPFPTMPVDPYVVYFDPERERFLAPPNDGNIPGTWVPVPLLLDATRLSEWVVDWPHFRDAHLRQIVFEAGKRLREYPVPFYVVDSDDEGVLKEIFYRVNSGGRRLTWEEIHRALFAEAGEAPSTLGELAAELGELGMGRLEEDALLQCLFAVRGLDVTQNLAEHRRRDSEVLRGAVPEALPPLRRALSFLRESAEIPHVRLLPRVLPLVVLARFFALHPEPNRRTRQLLTRWVWRLFFRVGSFDERTMLRKGVRVIEADDAERSTQELLKLSPPAPKPSFTLPPAFDARAAANRIFLVALSTLRPRSLSTGEILDIAAVVEREQADAFRAILTTPGLAASRTAANRILHPPEGAIRQRLIQRAGDARDDEAILASHAIERAAAEALARNDAAGFLERRGAQMAALVDAMGERLAAWSRNDRPSIGHLLREAGASP